MKTPDGKPQSEIAADALESKIDRFLAGRGLPAPDRPAAPAPTPASPPADFVCEGDVREAILAGRKVVLGERTIVTPSARELGEAEKIFVYLG
jgi:hypothetical protein